MKPLIVPMEFWYRDYKLDGWVAAYNYVRIDLNGARPAGSARSNHDKQAMLDANKDADICDIELSSDDKGISQNLELKQFRHNYPDHYVILVKQYGLKS
jgi:hypothetical protein